MMKKPILIIMMTICLGCVGCSSLGEHITLEPATYSAAENDAPQPPYSQMEENDSKTFRVFQSNPYTLNLEVERTDPDAYQIPVYGDGGVSLNAYAACLTLKVMF